MEGHVRKLYVAGKITGLEEYKSIFLEAEIALNKKGYTVANPAWINSGPDYTWEDYMEMSHAFQKVSDGVYFLDNWTESRGAIQEMKFAREMGQPIFFQCDGNLPDISSRFNEKERIAQEERVKSLESQLELIRKLESRKGAGREKSIDGMSI